MDVLVFALERAAVFDVVLGGWRSWVCILASGVSVMCIAIIEHLVSVTVVYLWNANTERSIFNAAYTLDVPFGLKIAFCAKRLFLWRPTRPITQ